jgi:hypothetical protein
MDPDPGGPKTSVFATLAKTNVFLLSGNPEEEKVSHAGLLVEGSDYIRSLMSEHNANRVGNTSLADPDPVGSV